jgi:hypothetical protein
MTIDVSNLTSNEIYKLIFKGKGTTEMVSIPLWIAEQVIDMAHLEQTLKDWAWSEILSELEE